MRNKKEVRLRTVLASEWVEPKGLILSQCSPASAAVRMSPRPRPSTSPGRRRCLTEVGGCNIVPLVLGNLLKQDSVLKKFPRRQSAFKNTNPYKFFMGSAKRIVTQGSSETVPLTSLLDRAPLHRGPFSIRQPVQPRPRPSKSTLPLRLARGQPQLKRNSDSPQPWALRESCDFDFPL